MQIELQPISSAPDNFTGWIVSPKGNMRYQNCERYTLSNDFGFRFKCPDDIYLYFSQGTLTHWSK